MFVQVAISNMKHEKTYSNQGVVEELFRKYYKILRAYAYRIINDTNTAEDIVQDAYYELWKKNDSLVFDQYIKYYLFKSVYTKALNYLHSKAYLTHEELYQSLDTKIQQIYIQSQLLEQENDLFLKELQEIIQQTVGSMPSQCRKVFLLSRKDELKNKEIAEQLGISVKAVEKHISKALHILRSKLNGIEISLLILFSFI